MGTLDFAETTRRRRAGRPRPRGSADRLSVDRHRARRRAGVWHFWVSSGSGGTRHRPRRFTIRTRRSPITDRPVYRPGQTMKFKFWVSQCPLRRAADVSVCRPEIQDPPHQSAERNGVREDVHGRLVRRFRRRICPSGRRGAGRNTPGIVDRKDVYGGAAFRVEEYKKPEFEVKVDAPNEPVRLGDKITATISANYYFGGPVTQASVHYKVMRTGHHRALVSRRNLGLALRLRVLVVLARLHVVSRLEALGLPAAGTVHRGSAGAAGSRARRDRADRSRRHGEDRHRHGPRQGAARQSRPSLRRSRPRSSINRAARSSGSGEVLVARKPFQVFAWTDRGYYQVGDAIRATFQAQTLDHKPVKGQGSRHAVSRDLRGRRQADRNASRRPGTSTPTTRAARHSNSRRREAGQYRLSYKLTDAKNQTIEGGRRAHRAWARGSTEPNSASTTWNSSPTSASTRRAKKSGCWSTRIASTARSCCSCGLCRSVYPKPQVLRLKGKSTLVEIGVAQKDMPNFFVEALTISNGRVFVENARDRRSAGKTHRERGGRSRRPTTTSRGRRRA